MSAIPHGSKVLWEVSDPRGPCYPKILREGWAIGVEVMQRHTELRVNRRLRSVLLGPSAEMYTLVCSLPYAAPSPDDCEWVYTPLLVY